jgi:hypothetical protein
MKPVRGFSGGRVDMIKTVAMGIEADIPLAREPMNSVVIELPGRLLKRLYHRRFDVRSERILKGPERMEVTW